MIGKAEFRQSKFEGLQQYLDSQSERAQEKYDDIARRLVKLFECNGCFPAEHFAAKTLRKVEQQLRVQAVADVFQFIFEVANATVKESHSFQRLLDHLGHDRESAGMKYEAIRRDLLRFFRHHDCSPADEYVDMTLERVAHKLGSEPVRKIEAFVMGFARNLLHEAGRHPTMTKDHNWDHCVDPNQVERAISDREREELRMHCLSQCIDTLSCVDRELFLAYYVDAVNSGDEKALYRRGIAQRWRLSLNALHVRAHRLMHKITRCVLERFAKSSGKLIHF